MLASLVLKRIFGFSKVRYRGLDKDANQQFVACGLVNLYMARQQLLRLESRSIYKNMIVLLQNHLNAAGNVNWSELP